MPAGSRRKRFTKGRVVALSAMAAVLAAGAGVGLSVGAAGGATHTSAHAAARTQAAKGGVATFAMPTGTHFGWILPFENGTNTEKWNRYPTNGMWLPLYSDNNGTQTGMNYNVSVAKPPVYSNGDSTVTINLKKNYVWSDGQKVTAKDVKFFFQLDEVGKHTLGEYVPGLMPDDIKSVAYPGQYTVVLHLIHGYNPTWFTGNQLIWIYALPAQTWNKTCTTCSVSGAATTPSGAKKVFSYLFSQSKKLATYASNPLWKTVDGPWVISKYGTVTHEATFTANRRYAGPTKPKLSGYTLEPYTTGTAEIDALRSGVLTYGWLPISDFNEVSYFKSHGYSVVPHKYFYGMDIEFGYTSKTWGALFRQLYVRQALQHLVTEQLYIKHSYHGYGIVDYGPVADYPGSPYVSPGIKKDPYPYSPSAAAKLLTEHGWKVVPGGTDVCEKPGTGAHDCGAGIAKGKALSFPFQYTNSTTAFTAQVSEYASVAKKIGIDMQLRPHSETTIFSIAGVCPSTPPCKWGMTGYSGYFWTYGPIDIVPSGEAQFAKGNYWAGGYTSPKAQRLIAAAATAKGSSLKALYADENYLSKDEASLWWPLESTIEIVKNTLKGWKLNPYGIPNPSTWYFKK